LMTESTVNSLVEAIQAVKKDTQTLQLQNEYFKKVKR